MTCMSLSAASQPLIAIGGTPWCASHFSRARRYPRSPTRWPECDLGMASFEHPAHAVAPRHLRAPEHLVHVGHVGPDRPRRRWVVLDVRLHAGEATEVREVVL